MVKMMTTRTLPAWTSDRPVCLGWRSPEMAAGGGKNCRRRPSDSLCLPAVSDR